MAEVKPIAPVRIGSTDLHFAQGVRAGQWLFFTGHTASDFARGIAAEGGDLRHVVRVDQYYPTHLAVNPYQRARKAILGDYVPPSTSVLMDELSVGGAGMDVSLLAVMPGDGREPRPARANGVPVPQHSGFITSLISGDYV